MSKVKHKMDISVGNVEETTIDTCYNIVKLQKYYAEWKKSDIQCHISHDSIGIKSQEKADTKSGLLVFWGWED